MRCGKRKHSFRQSSARDLLTFLTEPSTKAIKIDGIAHKAKVFDFNFILNREIA